MILLPQLPSAKIIGVCHNTQLISLVTAPDVLCIQSCLILPITARWVSVGSSPISWPLYLCVTPSPSMWAGLKIFTSRVGGGVPDGRCELLGNTVLGAARAEGAEAARYMCGHVGEHM
jgi:hypothetical protein